MIYRFGTYSLDSERLELHAGDELVILEPQVFTLLTYLLRNRNRVVSRDHLIEDVWKGRIVSDGTLNSRINSVRRAVGDTGTKQSIIKTIPRRGFRFVADLINDAAHPQSDGRSIFPKPAIAVLPFDNLSGDPEQEYFSDGMAEDLITDLSKISNLSVAARNSSFSFKGQMPGIKEVAEKLDVSYVLEGSVRKMGDRIRINAQLIDANVGDHLWAERYDGSMSEIFEFQDRIRTEIVSALKLKLTPGDAANARRKKTESVEAYDLFLRGRAGYFRYTAKHLLEAKRCLEEAIEIDPNFADAYGHLSFCHVYGSALMWPEFVDNDDLAIELAEKGVALDSTSAIALTRLGWAQLFDCQFDQATENLEKALLMAPDNTDVNATFGQILNYCGNPKRGLGMIEKAFSIDTFVPPNWEHHMGLCHLLMDQPEDALGRFNRSIERAPHVPAYMFLVWIYVEMDRSGDASEALATALKIAPNYTVKDIERLYPFRLKDVRARFLDTLRKAGLPEA